MKESPLTPNAARDSSEAIHNPDSIDQAAVSTEEAFPERSHAVTHDGVVLDPYIEDWVHRRVALVIDHSEDLQSLQRELSHVDSDFIESVKAHIPSHEERTRHLSCMLQYALELEQDIQHELITGYLRNGQVVRTTIEQNINETWQEIGWLHGNPDESASIKARRLKEQYEEDLPLYRSILLSQVRALTGKDESRAAPLVDRSLRNLSWKAEEFGHKNYIVALTNAVRLYESLPGRAASSHQLFTLLGRLSPQQQQQSLSTYELTFGEDFHTSFQKACDSTVVKFKNFFKLPALKAALEEKYGFGVGLFDARSHFLPHPRNWKAALATMKTQAHIVITAVSRVILPHPDRKRWHTYLKTKSKLYRGSLYASSFISVLATSNLKTIRDFRKRMSLRSRAIQLKNVDSDSDTLREVLSQDVKNYASELSSFFKSLTTIGMTPELERMNALLKHDLVDVAAHSLFLILRDSSDEMLRILADHLSALNADERMRARDRFHELYASSIAGQSLEMALDIYLDEKDAKVLIALLEGNQSRAHFEEFHSSLVEKKSGSQVEMLNRLAKISPEQIQEMCKYVEAERGIALNRSYLSKYLKGPMLDWAQHALEGDVYRAAAARLECSLRGISKEWPGAVFYEHPEAEDRRIIEVLKEEYGTDFWSKLRKLRGKERALIMQTLVDRGYLDLADQVRHCLTGVGSDREALLAILRDRTRGEIDELKRDYGARYRKLNLSISQFVHAGKCAVLDMKSLSNVRRGFRTFVENLYEPRDLEYDIDEKLSGYNHFDISELFRGQTSNPHKLYQRFLERYQFEHAEAEYVPSDERAKNVKKSFLRGFAESRLPEGMVQTLFPVNRLRDLKLAVCDEVHRYYIEHIKDQQPDEHTRKSFRMLVVKANKAFDIHREFVSKKADLQANIAAIASSTVAGISMTVMGVPYVATAIPNILFNWHARHDRKQTLKGRGYGESEKLSDGFLALVDGATFTLGRGLLALRSMRYFSFWAKNITSNGIKFAFKKSAQKWASTPLTEFLLGSRYSHHTRHHLAEAEDQLIHEFGRLLELEGEQLLKGRVLRTDTTRGIRRAFHRLGKDLLAGDES